MIMKENRWLGMKEITQYLNFLREIIAKWIENKKMPGHRGCRCWVFQKSEVDMWIKSGSAAACDDKGKLS